MSKSTPVHHEIHPLIEGRWSPRSFLPEAIEEEQIKQCLEAARWAASCSNEQPWHFIVVPRQNQEHFQSALSCLDEGNQVWAKDVGAFIFGVARTFFKRNQKENPYARYDLGQAVANFVLQAHHLGLVSHQMAGFSSDQCRERFQIPQEFDPCVVIALGKPGSADQLSDILKQREEAPRSRIDQAEFCYWNTWSKS